MSKAKQPQVSLTGTIQKLNIQVICFKPTIQLSHLNSTIYATPKCSYMYLSLTQNVFVFLSFFKKKKAKWYFSTIYNSLQYTLCLDKYMSKKKKKKKRTSTSLVAISGLRKQIRIGRFHSLHISFGLHIFSIGMSCNRTKLRAVDLREDNIKIHYITSFSQ